MSAYTYLLDLEALLAVLCLCLLHDSTSSGRSGRVDVHVSHLVYIFFRGMGGGGGEGRGRRGRWSESSQRRHRPGAARTATGSKLPHQFDSTIQKTRSRDVRVPRSNLP